MSVPFRLDRASLFRAAAAVWVASGLVRPLMYVTDAFGFASAAGSSIGLSFVGAAVGIAIGAFLWLRPGRASAITATAVGFYVAPSLALTTVLGLPTWLIVLAVFGLVAFGFSVACVWATRPPRRAA